MLAACNGEAMPAPGAGFLLATDGALDAGLAMTDCLLLIVGAVLLGFVFGLTGMAFGTFEIDARFVPVLPTAAFGLVTGLAAGVALGLALVATGLAAGFLTGLAAFLATGLALDLTAGFLPLAVLDLAGLAGLLFVTGLAGFLTGFLAATLVLDFPAEEDFALFALAILGTLP